MNILVTGGSGTIGSYVLRELAEHGHTVADLSRTPPLHDVEFVQGDIMDLERLAAAAQGRDAIIHLAAVPGPGRASPQQMLNVNVIGTMNVLEAAVKHSVPKVVLASSGAATGFSFQKTKLIPQYLPLDEEHPAEPQDEYGLSKVLAELTCKRYTAAYGLKTICLRINHNWYLDRTGAEIAVRSGWAKNFSSVEDLWTKRYLKCIQAPDGEWVVPGPPAPWKLLWAVTDARDAAQAFRLAAENSDLAHEVFQINGDDTCSLTETLTLIDTFYPGVPLNQPVPGFSSAVSHAKATRLLGYQPKYTWRDSDFSEWMQDQTAFSA